MGIGTAMKDLEATLDGRWLSRLLSYVDNSLYGLNFNIILLHRRNCIEACNRMSMTEESEKGQYVWRMILEVRRYG